MVNSRYSQSFPLGRVVMTLAVRDLIDARDIHCALQRHARKDWGDVSLHDRECNRLALRNGGRLFSTFTDRRQCALYIISEADRSQTLILLSGG